MNARLATPVATATKSGRWLHRLFELGLAAKALLASFEAVAGLSLLVTTNLALQTLLAWMTAHELAQDPTDRMALWFRAAAGGFSADSQHFYAVYLAAHGCLKLILVAGLATRRRWAYPAAMVGLSGFVIYQLREWTLTGSVMLLLLSALDLFMIALTWREYRLLGRQRVT